MTRKLTDEQIAFIRDNCSAMTDAEIARHVGIKEKSVGVWRRKFGVVYFRSKIPEEVKKSIVEAAQVMSLREISREFNIAVETARRLLKSRGVTTAFRNVGTGERVFPGAKHAGKIVDDRIKLMERSISLKSASMAQTVSTEIDPEVDELIPLGEAAKQLGKPNQVVRDYMKNGRDGIKLEYTIHCGVVCTTQAAIDRFVESVTKYSRNYFAWKVRT